MSFAIHLSDLSIEERKNILHHFTVHEKKTQYKETPDAYRCFIANAENDLLYLPLGSWKQFVDCDDTDHPNGNIEDFPKMNPNVKFTKALLSKETDVRHRDQDAVAEAALKRLLKEHSVFISCFTGFGKMCLGIYLSIALGLKTMVMCHLEVVREQWPDEYAFFTDNKIKVQWLEGKNCKLNPKADVYIIGVIKASLMEPQEFDCIGTLIIDESQITTAAIFTASALRIRPRYIIGLSATPDRKDGLDAMLEFYFGSPDQFIFREEKDKDFTVYKYYTQYKPTIEYILVRRKSVVNWNLAIKSIEENKERWAEIAQIAIDNPNNTIIILVNRNALAKGVYDLLVDAGESVGLLIGNAKLDRSKRITVAGFKKGGVGMNNPDLNMAIIASDTQDVRQYEGRLRTVGCTIYHFIDNYTTFEKHYEVCEEWYINKGANVFSIGNRVTNTKKKNVIPKGLPKKTSK